MRLFIFAGAGHSICADGSVSGSRETVRVCFPKGEITTGDGFVFYLLCFHRLVVFPIVTRLVCARNRNGVSFALCISGRSICEEFPGKRRILKLQNCVSERLEQVTKNNRKIHVYLQSSNNFISIVSINLGKKLCFRNKRALSNSPRCERSNARSRLESIEEQLIISLQPSISNFKNYKPM